MLFWGQAVASRLQGERRTHDARRLRERTDLSASVLALAFLASVTTSTCAADKPAADKSGFVGEKPSGDRSIKHGVRILSRLDASNRRQVAQLVNYLVLKELARLIGCGTNTSREINAPPFKSFMAMLRPTEGDEIETQCIGHRGIICATRSVDRCESVECKPRGEGGVLIWKRKAPPVYGGSGCFAKRR